MKAFAPALLTFILATGLHAAPPDEVAVDALTAAALKAWEVPGTAIVIVGRDGIVYLKGHGVRTLGGKAVTPDTVFPLASCTKAFTTTLLALLVDDGLLAWDDPVRKHLPDFHLSDPAADALVTLRDLTAHRTGLAGHDLLWYRAPWSQEESLRRTLALPLEKSFRTAMQYQSTMYTAAGMAAAKAGGKSWAELVRVRILDPLGMSGVTLTTTAAMKQADRSAGHRPGADGKLQAVAWYDQPEPNAAGSVNASARDLAPWLRLHLCGGRVGDDRLVSERNLGETHTPHTVIRKEGAAKALNPDTRQLSYGLAWVVQDYRGHLQLQHAGLIDGFRAHLTVLPDDGYAFAILANREGTRMNLTLSNQLTDLLCGLPPKDWNSYFLGIIADDEKAVRRRESEIQKARRPDAPSAPLAKFAGEYIDAAYGTATVRVEGDSLKWAWSSWTLTLAHYQGDTFRLKADHPELNGLFVRFTVEDGMVQQMGIFGRTFAKK